MHELAVTKSILSTVLDHTARSGGREVLVVYLVIGEMRNLEEDWIQRYFDYIAKGTPAAGARIKVVKKPILFHCKGCGQPFGADVHADQQIVCAHCGSVEYDLVSGRELIIEKVEIR